MIAERLEGSRRAEGVFGNRFKCPTVAQSCVEGVRDGLKPAPG